MQLRTSEPQPGIAAVLSCDGTRLLPPTWPSVAIMSITPWELKLKSRPLTIPVLKGWPWPLHPPLSRVSVPHRLTVFECRLLPLLLGWSLREISTQKLSKLSTQLSMPPQLFQILQHLLSPFHFRDREHMWKEILCKFLHVTLCAWSHFDTAMSFLKKVTLHLWGTFHDFACMCIVPKAGKAQLFEKCTYKLSIAVLL